MAWISKKELKKKLTELEKKVSELDPEKVSQRLLVALEELDQFKVEMLNKATEEVNKAVETLEKIKEGMPEVIEKAVEEKTKELSDGLNQTQKDLKTTDAQLIELTGKVKKFISSTREITKTVFQEIENKLREALGEDFFGEKPEETVAAELEQQEVAEGDHDST